MCRRVGNAGTPGAGGEEGWSARWVCLSALGETLPSVRGRFGGNTASSLFLLMQSAREPAISAAGGPGCSPARHVSSPPPRAARASIPAAAAARSSRQRTPPAPRTQPAGPPRGRSGPHGPRNHEGNCFRLGLCFTKTRVCTEPASPQRHAVGRKGTEERPPWCVSAQTGSLPSLSVLAGRDLPFFPFQTCSQDVPPQAFSPRQG